MSFTDVTCTYQSRSVAGAVQDYFTGATLNNNDVPPTSQKSIKCVESLRYGQLSTLASDTVDGNDGRRTISVVT